MVRRIIITAFAALLTSVGLPAQVAGEPTDSIPESSLEELTVTSYASKKIFGINPDASISITASMLNEIPSFLGGDDPVALLRTLPSVATSNELQPGIAVRGSSPGSNLFESDGMRIFNPMHLLGLFSTYNPAYYKDYTFRPIFIPPTYGNTTGGYFSAVGAPETPDSVVSGKASVGILESHGSISIPIVKKKVSIKLGARQTYLNLVYPSILKMGSSNLKYAFTDANANISISASEKDNVNISFFSSFDNLDLENSKNGDKEGKCGWNNLAGSVEWKHKDLYVGVNYSRFDNSFRLEEGGAEIDLPSYISQSSICVTKPFGNFDVEADIAYRNTSGRHTRSYSSDDIYSTDIDAFEYNIASRWKTFHFKSFKIDAGLRVTFYNSGNYFKFRPQPRISLSYGFAENFNLYCNYGMYYRFDKLVEVTTGGLPADFRVNASKCAPEERTDALSLGISGYISFIGFNFMVEGYWKKIRHAGEFTGSVIDFVKPDYNPLTNLSDGNGYSYGMSVMLLRQFGRFRFRAAYNLGKSRLKFDGMGNSYFPSAHDRLHDLTVSASFSIIQGLTASASFTHATGLPYTKAKYGYMIGENLICEYFPHNSSRLPSYNRLDLSVNWIFLRKGKCTHSLNASVYNALASNNVLFVFTSYSIKEGIQQKKSTMEMVIPSLTYSITF